MNNKEKKVIKPIQRLEINKEVYCRDTTINNIYINHTPEYHKGYFKALLDISNAINTLINYQFLKKQELSVLLKPFLAMILENCYINKIAETGCRLGHNYLYFSWGYKKGEITYIKLLSDNYKVDKEKCFTNTNISIDSCKTTCDLEYYKGYYKAFKDIYDLIDMHIEKGVVKKSERPIVLRELISSILAECYIDDITEIKCRVGFEWCIEKGRVTHFKLLPPNDNIYKIHKPKKTLANP